MSYISKHRNLHRYIDWKEMHDRNERFAHAILLLHDIHKDDKPPKKVGLIERVMRILRKI